MATNTLLPNLPPLPADPQPSSATPCTFVLAGSPNCGKTSIFNALTGMRSKTSNFPGSTVERRMGRCKVDGRAMHVLDLPGLYNLSATTPEEKVAHDTILGKRAGQTAPDAAILIADANNIERSLFLLSQLLEHDLPVIVALNMMDVAKRHGTHIDVEEMSRELGCPVVPMVARKGQGVQALKEEMAKLAARPATESPIVLHPPPSCTGCASCPFQTRYSWSDEVAGRCVETQHVATEQWTGKVDSFLTHPVFGLAAFMTVMLSVFYMIFSVATLPMDIIDGLFAHLGGWLSSIMAPGDLQSLLVDGILGGVGGILVFLPQICILFFFLALLEDSGYLARAAFVMDRLMRRIGLPGTAFVPLLSAHACAIPAIMATRVIRDPRDRLVTILLAPLMSCSARIPVYAMITALLFPREPVKAALLFTGAYMLGMVTALVMAFVFKKTILPGESKPLVLELPVYRIPSLRMAFLQMAERAKVFIHQAGTIILLISIALWALATYPKSEPPAEYAQLNEQAIVLAAQGDEAGAMSLEHQANALEARSALAHSFAGQLGKMIEPVVQPLGMDWQMGIGILSSFAAREVIVSTLAIVYGLGEDAAEENPDGLYDTLRKATHADGSPIFTVPTSVSMLVFYVLAMQCLPTQAITRRETNSWRWPIFQLAYMSVLAYVGSFVAYRLTSWFM